MAQEVRIPLISAMEEWTGCRRLLVELPLRSAVEDFLHRNRGVKLGVTVPDLVAELIDTKEQDGMSAYYVSQLRSVLGIFSRAFPGPIIDIQAAEIEAWLRSGNHSPQTRNNRLTTLRLLFNLAKQRSCLPAAEPTAPEQLAKVKVAATDAEIFQPEELEKLLRKAPALLVPYLPGPPTAASQPRALAFAAIGRAGSRAVFIQNGGASGRAR